MKQLLLFLIAVLPIIILCAYVYSKDKVKETPKLLIKLFIFGILSCLLTIVISIVLGIFFHVLITNDIQSLNIFELFIHVFIGVALVEEFSKWVMVYKISYNNKDFDEVYDMIIYSVFVALGFACFENIAYVFNYGVGTGIFRAILAVPGHACDGVFMGYFLGLAKVYSVNNQKSKEKKYVFYSLLVPTIIHGIYDYCLYTGKLIFIIAFFIFVIIINVKSIKKINKISKSNEKIMIKKKYCSNCGKIVTGNYCSNCGHKIS